MDLKVSVLSRDAMEELLEKGVLENTAVISFFDPKSERTPKNYAPINYTGKCERVFGVAIHDLDISVLEDFGLTFDTYFPEVEALARFIKGAVKDGFRIICQCEYGQSRSPACAAAIKEYYEKSGIEIFADYRYYPNQLVFNKILSALKKEELQA